MSTIKGLCLLICIIFLTACGQNSISVEISPLGNEMKYKNTRFEVKSGQKVSLTFKNTATTPVMKHNVVILTDKNVINEVGTAAITAKNYLPDHPAILAATPIVEPGQKATIEFKAPSSPGEYAFICTYPGHYMMMQGIMVVN